MVRVGGALVEEAMAAVATAVMKTGAWVVEVGVVGLNRYGGEGNRSTRRHPLRLLPPLCSNRPRHSHGRSSHFRLETQSAT